MSAAAAIAALHEEVQDFAESRAEGGRRYPAVRVEQDSVGQKRRMHSFAVLVDAKIVAVGTAMSLELAALRTTVAFVQWVQDQAPELASALAASVAAARASRESVRP